MAALAALAFFVTAFNINMLTLTHFGWDYSWNPNEKAPKSGKCFNYYKRNFHLYPGRHRYRCRLSILSFPSQMFNDSHFWLCREDQRITNKRTTKEPEEGEEEIPQSTEESNQIQIKNSHFFTLRFIYWENRSCARLAGIDLKERSGRQENAAVQNS